MLALRLVRVLNKWTQYTVSTVRPTQTDTFVNGIRVMTLDKQPILPSFLVD